MKKTLIALIALVGVASGATPIIDATFENALPEGVSYGTSYQASGEATYVDSGLEGYGMAIDFNKSGYISTPSDCTDYTGITSGTQASDFSIVTTVRFDSWAERSATPDGVTAFSFHAVGAGTSEDKSKLVKIR